MSSGRELHDRRFAIVGGGLSGLAAAWYLQRRGAETHIFESGRELGGRAISAQLGERLLTLGGKNIGRSYTRFRAFTASLGDPPYEYFGINSSRVIDGRMVTFDSKRRLRMLANLRGISPFDIARIGRLALMLKRDPQARYLGEAGCRSLARRYGADSVADAFSCRLRELLLRSLTVRVSAAEPDEVPMANVLPYVGMITDTYDQLAGGMHGVISAAAGRSSVNLRSTVQRLLLDGNRVVGVEITTPSGDRRHESFDGIIIATPAAAAARLLGAVAPAAASLLEEVRYFPLTVLLVEYERPVFQDAMRAVVFGPEEPLSNAGAYGAADLRVVRYTFSGRSARKLTEQEPDGERLAAMAERALAPHAAVSGNPRRALLAHRFTPGLCAYHSDQAGFLRRIGSTARAIPGLSLTGDYLRGCSIEGCFAAAEQAVGAIHPAHA